MTPIRVLLVVPEQGLLFEAAGVADIFQQANQAGTPQSRYEVTVASGHSADYVLGRSGVRIVADKQLTHLSPLEPWDTIVITGGGRIPNEKASMADWLKIAGPRARRVAAVCTGAFVLAEAGLLDGRRAVTHWKSAGSLAKTYPRVRVESDPIYVRDGPFWTSGGASSGFDLALALVEDDFGSELARDVAQYLVLFLRRPGGQSQFSPLIEMPADPGPIRAVQTWAMEHISDDLSVEKLADHAAMSPRNFARVFAQQTGVTPAKFVEQIRVEAARAKLERSRETLEGIAAACGLGTALTLRRTFERHLGVNPSEYRERFGMI
jgi:transcriptional regulator GlxA family with amidase domain